MKTVHTGGFMPEIHMPFEKLSGHSMTSIDKIGSTLTCNEQRNSVKDCAIECFNRSFTNTGCPGFYERKNENDVCHLCHVSNYSDVEDNLHTTLKNNEYIYLLRKQQIFPDIFMNFDNYSTSSIIGKGIVGTKVNASGS